MIIYVAQVYVYSVSNNMSSDQIFLGVIVVLLLVVVFHHDGRRQLDTYYQRYHPGNAFGLKKPAPVVVAPVVVAPVVPPVVIPPTPSVLPDTTNSTTESMYAANWTGQPGSDSARRATPLLVRVR